MTYTIKDLERGLVLWLNSPTGRKAWKAVRDYDREEEVLDQDALLDEGDWDAIREYLYWPDYNRKEGDVPPSIDLTQVGIKKIGIVTKAADFGGEGEGDQYWMVLKVVNDDGARFFRIEGWYASYDGGHLDGELKEVKPVEYIDVRYDTID